MNQQIIELIIWAYKQGYVDAVETLKSTASHIDEEKLKEKFMSKLREKNNDPRNPTRRN